MTSGFNYQEELSKCSTMEDITGPNGLVQRMVKDAIEQILQSEITDYITDEKSKGNTPQRNGTSPKKVKTSYGSIDIDVPRVREGEFEPEVIKKRAVIEEGLEAQIISMYAKGMTVRDIVSHVQALYGIELSPASVSNITDKIMEEAREWYSRTLDGFYPVVFLDAVHYKVRDEGAKFWLKVCNELKNRGVKDILIACIDGLPGFPDAIKTVFPETRIQLCIIHQIRNTMKYIAYKDSKAFMKDLKRVYGAESEEIAFRNLEAMKDSWKKYRAVVENWQMKWENLSTYFSYGAQIRRLIYTTNTLEGFNRQLRKVTKNKAVFPNDEALRKTLYLTTRDITEKWSMPYRDWGETYGQFIIEFGDRASIA